MMFFAFYINSIVYDGVSNINFMYVAGPPQDGLPYLNDNDGWLSYIIKYAILVIVAVSAFYIKPIVLAIKGKISSAKRKSGADANGSAQDGSAEQTQENPAE